MIAHGGQDREYFHGKIIRVKWFYVVCDVMVIYLYGQSTL